MHTVRAPILPDSSDLGRCTARYGRVSWSATSPSIDHRAEGMIYATVAVSFIAVASGAAAEATASGASCHDLKSAYQVSSLRVLIELFACDLQQALRLAHSIG
jgi:hypothetical protein